MSRKLTPVEQYFYWADKLTIAEGKLRELKEKAYNAQRAVSDQEDALDLVRYNMMNAWRALSSEELKEAEEQLTKRIEENEGRNGIE